MRDAAGVSGEAGGFEDQFEPAFVLYRAALVQVRAAERAQRARTEPRRRQEADAAASAMILTQAALEGWIKAACRRAEVSAGRRWLEVWREAPARIAAAHSRVPVDLALPDLQFLQMLNAVRNYLAHGDERSLARAREYLDRPEDVLAYYPALLVTRAAGELFAYGMAVTGLLAPTKARLLELQPDLLR